MPKQYSDNKIYSQNYLKRVKYIACEYYTLPFFLSDQNSDIKLNWFFKSKVEIEKIKLPQNPLKTRDWLDKETMNNIVNNFYPSAWGAVRVSPKMEVLDGYHQVIAAQKLGLKYLDIIIDYETALQDA